MTTHKGRFERGVFGAALAFGCTALLLAGCSPRGRASGSELMRADGPRLSAADVKGSIEWGRAESGPAWKTRGPDEIAPGFKLSLENPDDASIRGQYTVSQNGMLKLPYDVEVKAEGLTPGQLAQELGERYRRYLRQPRFKVTVDEKQYAVDVRGLVEKPGVYLLNGDATLDDAIAQAGGLQNNDDNSRKARYARVTQLGVTKLINLQDYYSGAQGLMPAWQGGEKIFLQAEGPNQFSTDRDYVQVLGQVSSPGAYPFRTGNDFVSYLTLAGGPTDRADLDHITLLRRDQQGVAERSFDLSDLNKGVEIRPGDTLIIQADNRSGTERSSSIASGFAAVISAIGLLAIGL